MRRLNKIIFMILFLYCRTSLAATSLLVSCPNWSTVIWTYGPNNTAAATAGGVTGVPFCLSLDGSNNILPTFTSVDLDFLVSLLAAKSQLDWLVANIVPIKEMVDTGIFDVAAMEFGFGAVVLLFVTGLGIGLVAGVVRKFR